MEDNYIADNLRYLRNKKGVSKTDIARALGVPVTTYHAWESGTNIPRDPMKKAIADYYGRTVQFIFFKRIAH